MKPWPAITRLFGILAVLTLVLVPFTAPAVADGMIAPVAADIGIDRDSEADGMTMADAQCCSPTRPSKPKGPKACPLAALCHGKLVQGVSGASAVLRWFSPARVFVPRNDSTPYMLDQAPPSRPPRA